MIWKEVKGFENYQVSNTGQVKNKHNRILKPTGLRYKSVTLNTKYYKTIHRLVEEAFIDNPNNYPNVIHKDNDSHNNNVDNLIWGTYSMNNKQAYIDRNQEVCRKYNSERMKRLHKQKSKLLKNYG